jgi:hypothetical protein
MSMPNKQTKKTKKTKVGRWNGIHANAMPLFWFVNI